MRTRRGGSPPPSVPGALQRTALSSALPKQWKDHGRDRPVRAFADTPLLLLAVLLALGAAVGHVRIAGVRLGPAAVLFAALGVSAWAAAAGVDLEIPEVIGTFGLVLFTYTIGVVSGTHFFASLRRGWPTMLVVAGALALVGGSPWSSGGSSASSPAPSPAPTPAR